ncbi:MAG: ATP-binding protein [Pleomorphochaeta sp.]
MKKVLVISGKGGTGKTTVSSYLIDVLKVKALADCDVDAPNLHLVNSFNDENLIQEKNFKGMDIYEIDQNKCISCGKCQTLCKFDSLLYKDGKYQINPLSCEGCGVCEYFCPVNAISPKENFVGNTQVFKSEKLFSTAKLSMGSGNSGKLVSQVKKNLDDNLTNEELVIIDGSPGIGCPVIASLAAIDLALIVTEPSLSGLSDMKRIIKTAKIFKTNIAIIINKADLNLEVTSMIEEYIRENNFTLLGKIDYDSNISKIINTRKSIANENLFVSSQLANIANNLVTII